MKKKPGKPALSVVGSPAPYLSTIPTDLSKAGRDLWQKIMGEYNIDDAGGRAMLETLCPPAPCPLFPRKRTCAVQLAMSAMGQ
jgi:hypothetical protein